MGRGHAGRRSREPRLLSGWVAIRVEAKNASRRVRLMRLPSGWGLDWVGFNSCVYVSIRGSVSGLW
jgi:hypothetical protein